MPCLAVFMVMFYLGVGIFLLFFAKRCSILNKAMWVIIGSTFLILRCLQDHYVTYKQIVKLFSLKTMMKIKSDHY